MRVLLRICFAACVALFLLAPLASAQEGPDYPLWEGVAERAEDAVLSARASDAAFTQLREELVDWRSQFQSELTRDLRRLETLREQVVALGPPPEDGIPEPEEITARRTQLNAEIDALLTPQRTAQEAFRRVNGIISSIDDLLRQRRADQLLRMGPWPINPVHWPRALDQASTSFTNTGNGVVQAWQNPVRRQEAQDNLPLILFLTAVGFVLLGRSRKWTETLALRVQRVRVTSRGGAAGFIVSLGQILLPVLGLFALLRAVRTSGLFGPRGEVVLATLEPMGLALFFALWLGSRLFPKDDAVRSPLNLAPARRAEARIYTVVLGAIFALAYLLQAFAAFERFDPATVAVLAYPLLIAAALLILRLGWILRQAARDVAEDAAVEAQFGARTLRFFSVAAIAVAVIGPLLATFGYIQAAVNLIYPAALTLALAGSVALLQGFVHDLYAALRRDGEGRDGLIPTLISFALSRAALPILALIWGARVTDLTELWARTRNGLTIGDITLTPGAFFTLLIVFTLGLLVTRTVQSAMKTTVLPKTRLDPGGQVAVVSGLGYVGIFLSAVVSITAAGINLSSLAVILGALSVGIGFGLQNIVSNFVSGIILLIERPISEGDWIEVTGGQMGYVRSISVRSTRIETFDRTDVIVPNADLISGTVTNYTRGNTVGRVIIPVGVAYGTDTRRVEAILREIAEAHPMALANPPPSIVFVGFGADSLDFEIRIILRDVNWMLSVKSEINHQIAERFTAEGIEIPFAQRDIWLRNPEALTAKTPPPAPAEMPAQKPDVRHLDESDMDAGDADADADGDGR